MCRISLDGSSSDLESDDLNNYYRVVKKRCQADNDFRSKLGVNKLKSINHHMEDTDSSWNIDALRYPILSRKFTIAYAFKSGSVVDSAERLLRHRGVRIVSFT